MQKSDIIAMLQSIHHDLLHNDDALVLDINFRRQSYDSLDLVEFVTRAEIEFDMSVDDRILFNIETPNDVVELIMEANHLS